MIKNIIIKQNQYHDSITLMRISSSLEELQGVTSVIVGMGTQLNKESCQRLGLESEALDKATPNDMIIGVIAADDSVLPRVEAEVEQQLKPKHTTDNSLGDIRFCSLDAAVNSGVGYNLALISTPGAYAAWEAEKALNHGMHVFMFSDNVSIENECRLKSLACKKGLLMMGPDCGTALINRVPLGFSNSVRTGDIGVVSASGTGLQEFMTLTDNLGGGIRSAIGTGGRDLSERVGGQTTLTALDIFDQDDDCHVIVVISKPPAAQVAEKIFARIAQMKKPCVVCLLGSMREGTEGTVHYCSNIAQAAIRAVQISSGGVPDINKIQENAPIPEASMFQPEQKYVRALYCGGTLADECVLELEQNNITCHTNLGVGSYKLRDFDKSAGNTVLDMGDDCFTIGKPHPMIEPSLRNSRLIKEALDPAVRVVLFDVELGFGAHPSPADVVAKAVRDAQQQLSKIGRKVKFVATLIGTNSDSQNLEQQRKILTDIGVEVFNNNTRAVTYVKECLGV